METESRCRASLCRAIRDERWPQLIKKTVGDASPGSIVLGIILMVLRGYLSFSKSDRLTL